MKPTYVELPLDRSGRNPNNLMTGVAVTSSQLGTSQYRILTLEHGGFYEKALKVYDQQYNLLRLDRDYILTYFHPEVSSMFGLNVYSAIVLINPSVSNIVYPSAQMVGGDVAFSFTVKDDYNVFLNGEGSEYKPTTKDYYGNEPIYPPGTLVKLRWQLDTYQPFNNALDDIAKALSGATGTHEQDYRDSVVSEHDRIMELFNNRLQVHIDDINNPHVDKRSHAGLNIVNNFQVATPAEAVTNRNDRYLTPSLSGQVINTKAALPLQVHISDRTNVHKVTPKQVGAYTPDEIDAMLSPKYNLLEVVENSTLGLFGTYKDYNTILKEYRTNLPAGNFTTGLISPNRLLRGTPSVKAVYHSNYPQWTTWEAVATEYPRSTSGNVYFANVGTNNRNTAHSFVVTTPPFSSAPNNSLVFYKLTESKTRVGSNGGYSFNVTTTYASFKDNSGAWIAI